MKMDPINHQSVVNEVLKRITQFIISGELKPGDKLPTEVEFIEQLGVGRNSIREAIKMLYAMGVLEVKRGHGTFITTEVKPEIFNPLIFSLLIEPKTGDDLYELRSMFESMVMFLAIDKSSEEDIRKLELMMDETKRFYDTGQYEINDFVKKDVEFHLELLKLARNSLIERIGKTIVELFPKYLKMSLSQKNGIMRSIKNHYEIIDVIKHKKKYEVFNVIESTLAEWKNKWKEDNL